MYGRSTLKVITKHGTSPSADLSMQAQILISGSCKRQLRQGQDSAESRAPYVKHPPAPQLRRARAAAATLRPQAWCCCRAGGS
eukprot:6175094-Pleurochrysis_carterae.AAC.2